MHLQILTTLLPLLPLALSKSIPITVGKGGLVFNPETVTAAAGDTLEFSFYPQSHSVAQSSFATPCIANETGVWSDFFPVTDPNGGNMTFTVTVNGTEPLWLYCSRAKHCQSGMVMVVNEPKSGNTLEAYKSAAQEVETATSPQGNARGGIVAAAGSNNSTASTSASASASGTSSSGTGTTTTASGTGTAASATGAASRLSMEVAGLGVMGLAGLVVGGMI